MSVAHHPDLKCTDFHLFPHLFPSSCISRIKNRFFSNWGILSRGRERNGERERKEERKKREKEKRKREVTGTFNQFVYLYQSHVFCKRFRVLSFLLSFFLSSLSLSLSGILVPSLNLNFRVRGRREKGVCCK